MAPGAKKDDRVRPETARREQVAGDSAGKAVPKSNHEKAGTAGFKAEPGNVSSANRKCPVPVPTRSASLSVDTSAGPASGGSGISTPSNSKGVGGLDRRNMSSVRDPRGLTALEFKIVNSRIMLAVI